MVLTGDHTDCAKSVVASTTTGMLVAQEILKLIPLACRPKSGWLVRMTGFGSDQTAKVRKPNVVFQPVVPGR